MKGLTTCTFEDVVERRSGKCLFVFSCQKDAKTHSCPQLEEASFSGEKTQYMGLDEQE